MNPQHLTLLLAGVLSLVAATLVQAGPPFVTDDPEPVDYQNWEFYIATQDQKGGGDWSGTAPHFELNYGVISNVQLHVIAPLAYDSPPDSAAHYGYGDTELGAKIRFLHETDWLPEAAIFPLVDAPTGKSQDNLGNGYGHWDAFIPLWLQKSWGNLTVYGGGGYGINSFSQNQNWGFYGAVLQNQILTNVLVGAEVYHQTAAQIDFPNSGTAFNVGTVIDLTEHEHLLFSLGRSIDGPVDFQCYFALQFTFDSGFLHFGRHPQ